MENSLFLPETPVGKLKVKARDGFITELDFIKSDEDFIKQQYKTSFVFNLYYSAASLKSAQKEEAFLKMPEPLQKALIWLSVYFLGEEPDIKLPLNPEGTAFQKEVFSELLLIPYGRTATYGELAKILALRRSGRMSARAVGQAAGKNPIAIFIPCHRLIGAGGRLTGFGGGLDIKKKLLMIEQEGIKRRQL